MPNAVRPFIGLYFGSKLFNKYLLINTCTYHERSIYLHHVKHLNNEDMKNHSNKFQEAIERYAISLGKTPSTLNMKEFMGIEEAGRTNFGLGCGIWVEPKLEIYANIVEQALKLPIGTHFKIEDGILNGRRAVSLQYINTEINRAWFSYAEWADSDQ